ncbi:MerR family DNA-binding protein [Aliiglaciecola sp. 3_MG-2023]|uniref:MerR family transcriptional regulator n=1 Tax=Aliiglaciecola sp. 3_MG-2023 TaxID=3062644 RepID=UPI0026E4602A|nr:MerR family transcriptional regulator [Aliiglaciecola sp. 3_MG-2023]MDO6695274.1 MerR family DNA-binding protein [Aliiglaciecola sp. 3_MG-2023]
MKIKDISLKTSTPASTLRYYEKIGLLPEISRQSGQRVYSESMLWRINFINAAKSTGFRLEEIKSLFQLADTNSDWRYAANQKLDEINKQIERLQRMQVALSHVIEQDCLDDGIAMFANKTELSNIKRRQENS